MGVPRLALYIALEYSFAIKHFFEGSYKTKVDNLYIDANAILHYACQKVFNYGQQKRLTNTFKNLTYDEKQLKVFEIF